MHTAQRKSNVVASEVQCFYNREAHLCCQVTKEDLHAHLPLEVVCCVLLLGGTNSKVQEKDEVAYEANTFYHTQTQG